MSRLYSSTCLVPHLLDLQDCIELAPYSHAAHHEQTFDAQPIETNGDFQSQRLTRRLDFDSHIYDHVEDVIDVYHEGFAGDAAQLSVALGCYSTRWHDEPNG